MELIKDEVSEKIVDTAEKIVTTHGKISVRMILKDLGTTNRVFYNRFHNIEEVLSIVYTRTVEKVRESMIFEYDGTQDYFDYVTDVVAKTLIASYDVKMKFNQYVFNYDSITQSNYEWYMEYIKNMFSYAKQQNLIKDMDEEIMSYAIWCFCRGYNADAVTRMDKNEAVKNFKYSFRILLEGLKK